MIGLDYGIELLTSSARVISSLFSDTGFPVYSQYSNPSVHNNIIIRPKTGIFAVYSGGDFTNNTIQRAEFYGISLEGASSKVKNNIISDSRSGIYFNNDNGSIIAGNHIAEPLMC